MLEQIECIQTKQRNGFEKFVYMQSRIGNIHFLHISSKIEDIPNNSWVNKNQLYFWGVALLTSVGYCKFHTQYLYTYHQVPVPLVRTTQQSMLLCK